MKFQLLRLAGAVALGWSLIALSTPAAAFAEERTCRGMIGARTVDNLRVPQGATCTLNGTYVKGTIKVGHMPQCGSDCCQLRRPGSTQSSATPSQ